MTEQPTPNEAREAEAERLWLEAAEIERDPKGFVRVGCAPHGYRTALRAITTALAERDEARAERAVLRLVYSTVAKQRDAFEISANKSHDRALAAEARCEKLEGELVRCAATFDYFAKTLQQPACKIAADNVRAALSALPSRDDVIERCAVIADMHDHRGDIGAAIRAMKGEAR